MTNQEIIKNKIESIFTPAQIHDLATAFFPSDVIAARAACTTVTDKNGNALDPLPSVEALLVVDLFHTYNERKRLGKQVKRGEKAVFSCPIWQLTDKPNAARRRPSSSTWKTTTARSTKTAFPPTSRPPNSQKTGALL